LNVIIVMTNVVYLWLAIESHIHI